MASQLQEAIEAPSGASSHSREEEGGYGYVQQNNESPLEILPNYSIQPTPSIIERRTLPDNIDAHDDYSDEPLPPYEEPVGDALQLAPVEYTCENIPQLAVAPLPEVSPIQSLRSPAASSDPTLFPAPLQVRPNSSNASIPRKPVSSQATVTTSSSVKAREAGFEIQPSSPRRTDSTSSFPSITLLNSTETLRHTREPGKLTTYLIPFPKPRLKGIRVEEIPDRFLVYTPPPPPLSKPAPGEKESPWHKTQRVWQEDVQKATMGNASRTTWKGMKARTTILIGKGVDLTRSSTVEFLDRVSGGTITSTTETVNSQDAMDSNTTASPGTLPALCPRRTSSSTSIDKDSKPKDLEELTLIHPPTLDLPPEKIRAEFVATLIRTGEKSRKEAVVASSLIPFAAGVDACLILTFGGLTEISAVWAHTSIKGAMTSRKVTKGLALAEEQAVQKEETEVRGCTCGHHENDYGSLETVRKGKGKKKGINLYMQQSAQLEVLRRYLDLACLKKEFSLFPQIEEFVGDVNEGSVLEAIGWQPTPRHGRDLEMEYKDRVETFTPEQDESWQTKEAKDDVKRIMKKGATEWVSWCKSFQKDFQKDPEAAMRR